MDSSGTLYVAYYDTNAQNLKFAIRDANGTWTTGTIDSAATVGASVVMDLDSTGKPGVAYTDSNLADLKYAHWNGGGWDVQTVGPSANSRIGYYPSLRYLSDKPTISHFVKTSANGLPSTGYLRIDQGNAVNATSWSTTTAVDNPGGNSDAGRFSSIRYNSATGKWGVSYDDDVNVVAKFAESSTSSITSTWSKTPIPVPSGGLAGGAFWTSLVYDTSGRPAFGYYDSNNYAVNVAYRNGSPTVPWTNTVVDGHNTTGKYPNLVLESGTFRVAYFDFSEQNVEVQHSTNGTTWTRDADLVTGYGSELKAIRSGGHWTFAWQGSGGNVYVNDDRTGEDWTQESVTTPFSTRARHSSVVFAPDDTAHPGEQMWVIGGGTSGSNSKRNDVYASYDGLDWREVRQNGGSDLFSARTNFAATAFDGKIWVIGGQTASNDLSNVGDVWSSSNGIDWTQATDTGGAVDVGARRDSAIAVYGGKMYLIGGVDNSGATGAPIGTVKSSSDGVTWTTETGVSTLANRYGATALTYKGALYVFGGTGIGTSPDVRTYKFDGSTWSQVNPLAPSVVTSLANGAGFVYDEKMWYLGGGHALWSTDGQNWTQAPDDPDFVTPFVGGRGGYTALAFAKPGDTTRMWLIAGVSGSSYKNDVWTSD